MYTEMSSKAQLGNPTDFVTYDRSSNYCIKGNYITDVQRTLA